MSRILAMEKWHKDKEFLGKELKQLEKVHLQQVLLDIENDELTQGKKQLYGDMAFKEWLKSHSMESKTTVATKPTSAASKDKTTTTRTTAKPQPKIYQDQPKEKPAPTTETLYKANSVKKPDVMVTKPTEESKNDSRRRVEVVTKQTVDKGSPSPKLRTATPMTRVSEESGDVGLHEKPEEYMSAKTPSDNLTSQDQEKDSAFVNPNPWIKSTKVRESDYQPILKDVYPRDEYTKLPVKPKTAPAGLRRLKTNLCEEELDQLRQSRVLRKVLRMPKLPKETVERTLSGDTERHHRPVMFKSKTMLDVPIKRKLEAQERPKSEVVIHLSNAVESPMFQFSLQPALQGFLDDVPSTVGSSGSMWSVDSYIKSNLIYDLQRFTKQTQFPKIRGEEYDINTGKYAMA